MFQLPKTCEVQNEPPLLKFVKIQGLDPAVEPGLGDRVAGLLSHLTLSESEVRGLGPDYHRWSRLLSLGQNFAGLHALSIKALHLLMKLSHDAPGNPGFPRHDSD